MGRETGQQRGERSGPADPAEFQEVAFEAEREVVVEPPVAGRAGALERQWEAAPGDAPGVVGAGGCRWLP